MSRPVSVLYSEMANEKQKRKSNSATKQPKKQQKYLDCEPSETSEEISEEEVEPVSKRTTHLTNEPATLDAHARCRVTRRRTRSQGAHFCSIIDSDPTIPLCCTRLCQKPFHYTIYTN